MAKISVVLPTYNRAKLLPRAIDSILAQSFVDFELIIVDDGSTDESSEIFEKYTKQDKRVKIFSTGKNSGVSVARNLGISKACGEILICIDSDDYVLEGYFSDAIALFELHDADIVNYGSFMKNGSNIKYMDFYSNEFVGSGMEYTRELFLKLRSSWFCNNFVKIKLLDGLGFDKNVVYGEDLHLLAKVYVRAEVLVKSSKAFYVYDITGIGGCRGGISKNEKLESLFYVFDDFEKYFGEDMKMDIRFCAFHHCFSVLVSKPFSDVKDEYYLRVKRYFDEIKTDVWHKRYFLLLDKFRSVFGLKIGTMLTIVTYSYLYSHVYKLLYPIYRSSLRKIIKRDRKI